MTQIMNCGAVAGCFLMLFLLECGASLRRDGDVVINKARLEDRSRQKRQVLNTAKTWGDGIVFYEFDADYEENARKVVKKAMDHISARTCIDFHESQTSNNRLVITPYTENPDGCWSAFGMRGGKQNVSLVLPGCNYTGKAAHEIMHSLGMVHTHKRNDRDDYILVNQSVVRKDRKEQFEKQKAEELAIYTPYEYGSVMHYAPHAFAENNAEEITPLDSRYFQTIGSYIPSFYDIMNINRHYGCNDRCERTNRIQCANDGVPNPRQCDACLCPYGYGGRFCDQRPAGCGETLKASSSWKTKRITFESSPVAYDQEYRMCNYWVEAPLGKWVEIRVKQVEPDICFHGCMRGAIEPKVLRDRRITNPRYCCNHQIGDTLVSKLNPTPVFAYSNSSAYEFTFQYRYREA